MQKNLEISTLLDYYGNVLTARQREVMEQYYNEDLSLAEIAENFGITRQGVRDAIKRGEVILLDLEEQVGFARHSRRFAGWVDEMQTLARNIAFYNDETRVISAEIPSSADRLVSILDELAE